MDFLPYQIKKLLKKQYVKCTYNKLFALLDKKYSETKTTGNKNVFFINTLAGKGGAAKIAYDGLYKGLKNKGYNTSIAVKSNHTADNSVIEIPKLAPKEQKLLLNEQLRQGWLDFFYLQSFKIKDLKEFKQADILHLHNLHGDYFSPFTIAELSNLKPTIWTLHDEQAYTGHCACIFDCNKWESGCLNCPNLNNYPGLEKDTANFLWETKKKIYQKSRLTIVCPSIWLKNMVERSILGHCDIRIIYNGVDTKIFNNLDKNRVREELNLPKDKKILMFSALSGLDDPLKGGEFVKKAYEYLKPRNDVFFLSLGGKETKQIDENFMEVEYVSDENILAKYYAASDLFIYPSLTDNCPLSVLESMSCGTPVITFKTGGIPELIEHRQTGYLSNYKNTDDFINGIELFLNDSLFLESASLEAREKVLNNFSLDIMLNKYEVLYKEVLNA